jgi:TonB family protein
MATAPRQISLSSGPSNRDFPPSSDIEQATVEESPGDVELISLLREAAMTGSRPLEAIVDALADAARILSGADGTALGLETDGLVVCRARSGTTAPPIGAPISAESGISGECLRTVTMLVCHDSMADPRVDAEVCRSLGIRSVVAVPVRGPRHIAGILEAFSARPNAFDGDGLTSLRDLAEIAETAYRREVGNSAPAATPSQFIPSESAAQSTQTSGTAAVAERGTFENLSLPNKNRVMWIVGIAVALLLIVGVAWWAWHTPGDEAASTNPQNVRAANAEPTVSAPSIQVIAKPAPGVGSSHSDRSRNGIVQTAAEVTPINLRAEDARAAAGAPETLEVGAPEKASDAAAPVVEPPAVDLAPSNTDTLARLTSGATPMPMAPRVSQGVTEATLIRRVEPAYPIQARNQRLQGKVTLSATIAADGSVPQVDVVNGPPVLAEAAKAAVKNWRFSPAKLNGTPIQIQKEIIVFFALP